MAKKMGIYKCSSCGTILEVMVAGGGDPVCCGESMHLLNEKNRDGAGEKHMPVIEPQGSGVLIKIGSVPHPMEADHWIQFIEVIRKDGKVGRHNLNPGEKPEAFFTMKPEQILSVRELCNMHGLWAHETANPL